MIWIIKRKFSQPIDLKSINLDCVRVNLVFEIVLLSFLVLWSISNNRPSALFFRHLLASLLQTGARLCGVNSAIVQSQFDFKMVGSWGELSFKSPFLVFWKFHSIFIEDSPLINDQACTTIGRNNYIVKNFSIVFFPATENLAMGSVVFGFKSFQACYKVRFE